MKKNKILKLEFERGDYAETPQGFFIYLGENLWVDRDSLTLYQGKNQYSVLEGHNLNLTLFYICEGKVVKHLLKGIPEQKDCYVKQ